MGGGSKCKKKGLQRRPKVSLAVEWISAWACPLLDPIQVLIPEVPRGPQSSAESSVQQLLSSGCHEQYYRSC